MFYVKALESPLVLPYSYRELGREPVRAMCVITQSRREYEHHVCQAHDLWIFWAEESKTDDNC